MAPRHTSSGRTTQDRTEVIKGPRKRPFLVDMEKLYATSDKLFNEVYHLECALDADELDEDRIKLAIAALKRVRKYSTLSLQELAKLRDQNATAEEA